MIDKYILNREGIPVPCEDLLEWAFWFEASGEQRVVAKTELEPPLWRLVLAFITRKPLCPVRVSTVFLGLNHQFEEGMPPLLYETMIFGGPCDDFQFRYHDKPTALIGHAVATRLAIKHASLHRSFLYWLLSLFDRKENS